MTAYQADGGTRFRGQNRGRREQHGISVGYIIRQTFITAKKKKAMGVGGRQKHNNEWRAGVHSPHALCTRGDMARDISFFSRASYSVARRHGVRMVRVGGRMSDVVFIKKISRL